MNSDNKRLCFLISGNGSGFQFVQTAIENDQLPGVEIVAVISNKSDAKGIIFAKEHDLLVKVIDNVSKEEFEKITLEFLEDKSIDLICLSSYRWLLSPNFIDNYPNRIINSHPSLLPLYRGFKAIDRALADKVKETGTTIHFVDENADSGKIIRQGRVPIIQGDTIKKVFNRVLEVEKVLYVEAIKDVLKMHNHNKSIVENDSIYWQDFWNQDDNICLSDPQKNVGRTCNGIPITQEYWKQTIKYITELVSLQKSDTLIELCCGNALLLGPLAKNCTKATGVDFSQTLLNQAHELFPNAFTTLHGDVLDVELPENSADVVLIYFAIQHFDHKKAVLLIEKAVKLLKPGGRLLVGDIPEASKLWQYVNKPEYRKDYIKRIVESRPMIGTWFDREFFEAIGEYLQNVDVKILQQPEFLINSNFRFDVLYTRL